MEAFEPLDGGPEGEAGQGVGREGGAVGKLQVGHDGLSAGVGSR